MANGLEGEINFEDDADFIRRTFTGGFEDVSEAVIADELRANPEIVNAFLESET